MKYRAIVMSVEDNVATALENLEKNQAVEVRNANELKMYLLKEAIPFGHKFATKSIQMGSNVIKYGQVIGAATQEIQEGTHVHIQNVESLRGRGDKQ